MMPTKEEDETMDNFLNNNNQPQSQTGGLSKAELRKVIKSSKIKKFNKSSKKFKSSNSNSDFFFKFTEQ